MRARFANPGSARQLRRGAVTSAVAALLLGSLVLPAGTALAAPGDAFDPNLPQLFVGQGLSARLATGSVDASGALGFTELGSQSWTYNAMAFNPADGYVYAMTSLPSATVSPAILMRIGQGGAYTFIGTEQRRARYGAINPADGFLYTYGFQAGVTPEHALERIRLTDGSSAGVIPLSGATPAFDGDFSFAQGYLWSAVGEGIDRWDPVTGVITRFPIALSSNPSEVASAAWTYGNGNLGFLFNTSGTVVQLAIDGTASATPSLRIVASSPGLATTPIDGTSAPGLPTDLGISLSGPSTPSGGAAVSYTLTVRNASASASSGFVVNSVLPSSLSNVASSTPGCIVRGQAVQCVSGALAAGAARSFSVTAQAPATVAAVISTSATVTANEADPVAGNNSATASTSLPASPSASAAPAPKLAATGFESSAALWLALGGIAIGGLLLRRRQRAESR